jgi:hypothetical protein
VKRCAEKNSAYQTGLFGSMKAQCGRPPSDFLRLRTVEIPVEIHAYSNAYD